MNQRGYSTLVKGWGHKRQKVGQLKCKCGGHEDPCHYEQAADYAASEAGTCRIE